MSDKGFRTRDTDQPRSKTYEEFYLQVTAARHDPDDPDWLVRSILDVGKQTADNRHELDNLRQVVTSFIELDSNNKMWVKGIFMLLIVNIIIPVILIFITR